jgi:hypothetical protein
MQTGLLRLTLVSVSWRFAKRLCAQFDKMVTESEAVDIEETTKTKSTSTKSSGGQGADTSAMSGGSGAVPTESSSQSTASSKKASSTEQGQTAPPAGETAEMLFTAEQSTTGQEGSPSDTLTSVAAAASTASPSNAAAASGQVGVVEPLFRVTLTCLRLYQTLPTHLPQPKRMLELSREAS